MGVSPRIAPRINKDLRSVPSPTRPVVHAGWPGVRSDYFPVVCLLIAAAGGVVGYRTVGASSSEHRLQIASDSGYRSVNMRKIFYPCKATHLIAQVRDLVSKFWVPTVPGSVDIHDIRHSFQLLRIWSYHSKLKANFSCFE